ncbi:MAG: hypothetical protein WBD48_00760, partial [Pseudolabrys sp.]
MFLRTGAVVAALLMSAAAFGGTAEAQYYSYPPGYRGPPPAPAYGYGPPPTAVQPGPPSRILPYPEEADAAPLPPPGFAPPGNGQQTSPGYGHQLDQQPPRADGPDVIRPPGAIGATPQQAAPQPGAPAANAALPPEDQPE